MKRIISAVLLAFIASVVSSCIDDTTIVDGIKSGPNLIGFSDATASFAGIADGSEYPNSLKVRVFGPNLERMSGGYTATVEVDEENSTAIEGTHFMLPSTTIEIDIEGENYLTTFPIVMLSEGIVTPLEESPVLVLKVSDVEGEGSVIPSGASVSIKLNYLCPSFLSDHDYDVHVVYDRPSTGFHGEYDFLDESFTLLNPGKFQTESTGHWGPGDLSPPAAYDGFIFTDVCGEITIEPQNLGGYYSNQVSGSGAVDPDTGNIHMEFTVCASDDCREYVVDYVRK